MSVVVRSIALAAALAAGLGATLYGACGGREMWPGPKPTTSVIKAPSAGPVSTTSSVDPFERLPGPHPRILLTSDRVNVLSALQASNAPSWRALVDQCEQARNESIASGYMAWDWANASLALALCYRVTRKPEYATAGIKYFTAMIDDETSVGDGKGGDEVVVHDDGYGIRTRGAFGAIAYDWLHDVPGMTPELRKHWMDRLMAWVSWFREKGYNRDAPIANYYIGYFGAVAFGGIATEGEDPRANELRMQTRHMWTKEIVPTYRFKLEGGDFPEGWQYGDMVGAILAIYTEAENTAHPIYGGTPRPLSEDLPWLRSIVTFRAHALEPDGKQMFDGGDWEEKPPTAPPHALMALSLVFSQSDAWGRQAAFLAKLARDPSKEEWKWLQALSEDPSRALDDPRKGATSYLAKGTGTIFARTDWTPAAVWLALTSAPSLSDHQHLDASHFEIVRGSDQLVIDSAGYGAYSSLSHNLVAVDDNKENLVYSPSQGTWSDTAQIARFEEAGDYAYGLADYTSAFNPPGYPKDHPRRSVTRAERELIFSRAPVAGLGSPSARVVIYDRLTVTKPSYKTTFLLHGWTVPEIKGTGARISNGKSVAWMTSLLPVAASLNLVNEPTQKGDRAYFNNEPPEGMKTTRIEIATPGPAAQFPERRFLTALVVGGADRAKDAGAQAVPIQGDGANGCSIDPETYVFPSAGDQTTAQSFGYEAQASAPRHIVTGLAPGASYAVTVEKDGTMCKVRVSPGKGKDASSAGTLRLDMPGCVLR